MSTITPVGERFHAELTELSTLTDSDRPGWTRRALSEFDIAGRDFARTLMKRAGLETRIDGAGNVIGVLRGRLGGREIMLGSHTDTVDGGGRFDGVTGVLGAIEVVRLLQESDVRLDHDLVVVVFFNEEPNDFGFFCVGSRAMTRLVDRTTLAAVDTTGRSLAQALPDSGIDPESFLDAAYDFSKVTAFLELHIEQGPELERIGKQIGVVETITGINHFKALFTGRQDHAGTTPMDVRADAGCAAAGTVLAVEAIAESGTNTRGTSGQIQFTPEAVNVVSATASLEGEFRGPDGSWLNEAQRRLTSAAAEQSEKRGVHVEMEWTTDDAPVPLHEPITSTIAEVADDLGLSRATMFSGAGHDAGIIAAKTQVGMIFVPSVDGRSHCPEEFTDLGDIVPGISVLLEAVLRVDGRFGS
ncbi:M20 family metallo-hydrolase [Brevibacterium sp. ZH18]|uniref:M20 family metallo-hydrolase n=1 Tax=Brevibacterium sp. ZH18 TaxID=2927784 RepID=UPI001F60A765|nr:M20 family metallo-hydrolase [Brevibacterium sp. ZH18]MCI4011522.1 M20 family metallo-hydrolase [Brevibacterium sp. ZH18]